MSEQHGDGPLPLRGSGRREWHVPVVLRNGESAAVVVTDAESRDAAVERVFRHQSVLAGLGSSLDGARIYPREDFAPEGFVDKIRAEFPGEGWYRSPGFAWEVRRLS